MATTDHPLVTPSADVTATAIHLLARQGYDATSVDQLADALEVSRSTFFRRFGTKEDIVFADHTYLLERINEVMSQAPGDGFDAVNRGCLAVIGYHVSRPDATKERRALLRSNPSLRERELVMSHRYERVFRTLLTERRAAGASHEWMASAYAAAAVAVHNDALRAWFADETVDAVRNLRADLDDLAESFRAHAAAAVAPGARMPGEPVHEPGAARARVVVTVYDDAPVDEVLASIRRAVER